MSADRLHELAQQLRVDSVRVAAAAGSGHPTSSLSAADLMAVLFANHLRYDFTHDDFTHDPHNDRLIFSKGHASPLLYALFRAARAISEEELLSFRRLGSRLEGHPTPALPWVDVATGSLGQGLPCAVGLALAGKRLDRLPFRVWVLCGDSEMAEGSVWEALEHAAFYELDNLIAIVDVNRLGQRGETMHGWDLASFLDRARAVGCHAIETDGHDIEAIEAAYAEAVAAEGKPSVLVARTVKGKGVRAVEDLNGFHGRPLADPEQAIAELGGERRLTVRVRPPNRRRRRHVFQTGPLELPHYPVGESVATRKAYGQALAALGCARGEVVALDGEVSNSTCADIFRDILPERYFEMYIAEQQLVAAAVGMQVLGWRPFASTFAAFLSRAHDFIRMAAVSRANLCLVGSHAGVSIGQDGPSQMGLEDIAMFRAVHGSTVLYPACANQTAKLVPAMADRPGVSYLRTTRAATPVLYAAGDQFAIGGSRVLRCSVSDDVTLVAAGITVHEALAAAEDLDADGICCRVIDLYSIKPIDEQTLRAAAASTRAIVTIEDHHPEGGLGEAVLSALAAGDMQARVRLLAVATMPTSGTPEELLAQARIDRAHIAEAARELLRAPEG